MSTESASRTQAGRWHQLAWLPLPLLLAALVTLWVADVRVVWPLPLLNWIVHYGSVALGVGLVVLPAARSFLASGRPGVLMLGCGVLTMDIGAIAMPTAFARSSDTAFAIYNTSVLLSALCQFAGVAMISWRKIPLGRTVACLTAAYAGAMAAMALVIWGAFAGRMPVFFIEGQGGTLLRGLTVSTAVALFLLTAGLLWQSNRRTASPFLFWYALGLVLLAAGLAGSMVIAVKDSPLQWTARITQFFGGVYLCVAVLASLRESGAGGIPLDAVADAWRKGELLAGLRQQTLVGWIARYGAAVGSVAAGWTVWLVLTAWLGAGLPAFITFYPAVMLVALLAGVGPGLLATLLAGGIVAYWILPPVGELLVASPVDRMALAMFGGMGVLMSVVAEFYRRSRRKAAAYDQGLALRETRREKEFLADIVEHASQAFAVGYPDGRLGLLNRSFERLTGYTAAELRSLDWSATLTPPEWREREQQQLDELHRTGQPVRYEKEYVRKDGSRVAVELLVHLVCDAAGKPEYYYSFLTDITERKRAAREQNWLAEQRQVALDATRLGWWHYDPVTKMASYDQRYREIFGVTGSERPNEEILARLHPDDLPGVWAKVEAALNPADPQPYAAEYRVNLPDGSIIWVEAHGVAAFEGQGAARRATSLVGTVGDVTERKRAEERARAAAAELEAANTSLQESRTAALNLMEDALAAQQRAEQANAELQREIVERKRGEEQIRTLNAELEQRVADRTAELRTASLYARSLLEASLDPLVTINAEGKITDVNEASALATGLPRERLLGTDFSDYFTEPQKAREGYSRVFAEGLVRDYPLALRHASGRVTDVLYNATVYRNEAGAVQGVFAAARDVTERKRAEAELARYREHLEELVKLRTAELARSNQELEQFAYVASHDLQEPLRAVAGYVGLIERRLGDTLDEKVRHHIAGATQGAARMERLITDLLQLSRVGTQGSAFRPVDLAAVLEQVMADYRTEIRASGAVVTSDPLPTLEVDAGQMAQLFGNLLGNALKFRGARPPEIHVSARRDTGRWVLGVRDNGLGIEPQYFERIFVIFQRLHTRQQYPGTGIGLAICKKIVERHGGKIWVESQPGQGSTFYFTLPERKGGIGTELRT
jgi:PAS domain S-box-containing protein